MISDHEMHHANAVFLTAVWLPALFRLQACKAEIDEVSEGSPAQALYCDLSLRLIQLPLYATDLALPPHNGLSLI